MNRWRVIFWNVAAAEMSEYGDQYDRVDVVAPSAEDAAYMARVNRTMHSGLGHRYEPGPTVAIKPWVRLRDLHL